MKPILAALLMAVVASSSGAQAAPIAIVAAENFYSEAASAIGGDRVTVESIISAPGVDPHDFDPPPSVARQIADADIVIVNGADYDPWTTRLLDASQRDKRIVIDVAKLIGIGEGGNPHIWYDPRTMPALAEALAAVLNRLDPQAAAEVESRRQAFLATLAPLQEKIETVRRQFAGTPVVATEPVFGYMADALGLAMKNQAFQTAVMNETEPAASDVAAMEDAIRTRKVKVLFYNAQVEDAFTKNLADLATASGVPLVGVTETQPEGIGYAEWMLDTVKATAKALGDPSS
jgi:zinc/manganese transport system substrate-binding protein